MRESKPTTNAAPEAAVRKNSAQFAAVCHEILNRGLHLRFTAEGQSMQPNILSGDRVLVAPASETEMAGGRVVLTEGHDGLRIHRLIGRVASGGAAITRGDAGQEAADADMHQEILGQAIALDRNGKHISLAGLWTRRLHAARILVRKLRLAGRRRLKDGFLALVPVFILWQLFAGAAPVRANTVPVTITQTPSVATVSPGGQVTYTDVLMNTNNTASTARPVITQPIPTNTTYVSIVAPAGFTCTTGAVGTTTSVACTDSTTFPKNGTATLMVTVKVNAGVAGQTLLNANSTPTVTPAFNYTVTTNITSTVTVLSADLALTQTATPTTVAPGGTIVFANTVTNNGASTAVAPVLTFPIPGNTTYQSFTSLGYTCAGVPVGSTGTLTCTATSDAANGSSVTVSVTVLVGSGVAAGTMINGSASVTSTTFDPSTPNPASSSSTVVVADLSEALSTSSATVAQTGTISYTMVTTNNGPSPATAPTVTFATPANTVLQSVVSSPGATCTGVAVGATGTITCTYAASIASGANGTIVIAVTVNSGVASGTVITGTASVSSTTSDPVSANNSAGASVTVATNDLGMTQSAAPSVVASGSNITYTEVVTNSGPAPAPNAVLYQQTPLNTVFASITAPSGWACAAPAVGGTGNVTCTDSVDLPVSTPASFTYVVKVNAGTAAGTTVTNSANVTSSAPDTNAANNATTTTVLVETAAQADIAVSISAAPTPVFVFSTLTYTVQLQDLGLVDAVAVVLTDPLPSGTTLISATPSQGTCSGTATVTCALGTIPNGNKATVTISVTSPATAATLTNVVSETSTTTDPVATNNSATAITVVQPLVCAMPGHDGTGGTLNSIVNAYYAPAANGVTLAGAKTITLAAVTAGGANTSIAAGDLLLIIQMQDAAINATNTGAYGDGVAGDPATGYTALNNAGNFEFVTATNAVANTGGALTFTGTGAGGGLLNTYTEAAYLAGTQGQRTFQVIRVPQYTTATLASGFTALAWNGGTGGVAAIDVASQLTLGGPVVLDGLGFRGGAGRSLGGGSGANTDYVTLSTNNANGSKGEGIAGTPAYVANAAITNFIGPAVEGYPNGSYARGAPANAGAGATDANTVANDQNSGGGGGGDGGTGGQGGFGWNSAGVVGGFGGSPFPASTGSLVLGGGAGAGTTNNGTSDPTNANPAGINSSGAAGGGILIIHAGSVVGTGTISANGQTALNVMNDGGGGGGAGGSIRVLADAGGIAGLTVSANGGNGGNTWSTSGPGTPFPGNRHGPGGGGAGGVLTLSGTPAGASVLGGINGMTTTAADAYGATPGTAGKSVTNITIPQTPGVQPGAECASADISVTNTGTPNPVSPGGTITYTQVVNNAGPQDAINAVFSEAIPANTTFQSITAPAGWTCNSTASILATGTITCTDPSFASRLFGTFTVAVTVKAGTTFGTQIVDTATITSGSLDSNLTNNSATVSTVVGSATSAYVTLTKTAASNTVVAGSNITYTMVMTNQGPAAAAPNGLYDTIPTNTTFVSIAAPGGWNCSTVPPVGGTGNIVCAIPSFANNATATFTLVVHVNAGVPSGTIISNTANANSPTANPNPTGASATAVVTVAGAAQSDLSLTSSATPNPVLGGNNITFTQVLTNNGPAGTIATYTQTIPAGSTFVSLVNPAGWTCVTPLLGATGTITCTSTAAVPSGGTATFPVVVQATATDAPGTVVSNTATAGPTATDPNTVNNTATSSSVVTSPTQADVSIVKTATPEPVDQSTNLTYTLQVTNNGPAVAQNVTVSDPLPAQITFVNVSTTQGTCTQASGTVSCSIGTLSVGGLAIITINASASTFSTSGSPCATINGIPYSVCNTATVASSTSDPNPTNNSSSANSTIQSPTAVQLSSFRAQRRSPQDGGGVLLEWHTQEEIRNLGFNVYREDGQGRHKVNPSIIAGAALFVRGGRPQHGAKTYFWIDPAGTSLSSYVLEDVDLNGTRSTHGPVTPETSTESAATFSRAKVHSAAPVSSAAVSQETREISNAPLLTELNQLAGALAAQPVRILNTPRPAAPTLTPRQYQASLDLLPALKIGVQSEGWYRITHAQLLAAGFNPGIDPRFLQLYAEGVEQPMFVPGLPGIGNRNFQGIEFYGTGIDTPYSGTRVYWLVKGTQPGKRVTEVAAPVSGSNSTANFLTTVIHEDRTTYFATLLNGEDNDNFFGDAVTSAPVDEQLTVAHLDANSAAASSIDVTLQGVTDQQAHRVSVSLNGTPLGEMDFSNQASATNNFPISTSQLQEGSNIVTLTALDGDNDVSLVQSVALHYPHAYAADGNWLRATAPAGATLHITAFTDRQIMAFDISDPLSITQLAGNVQPEAETFTFAVAVPNSGSATHSILVFSLEQLSAVSSLTMHQPDPAIHKPQTPGMVVISHPDFVNSLAPLVTLHQSQGQQVTVITTEQIFDAFNFGERSPYAIRAYLQQLAANPQGAPQSVLFVGDASVDPRNYLGFGYLDFTPTRIIETAAFKTASDDWFTDFDQTGFASIPSGRIPARTAADADLIISKIVNYESGASRGPWNQQALLIADQNIDVNFTNEAAFAAAEIPLSLQSTKIYTDGQDVNAARQQILDALNSGALLVNYTGHGSTEQWSFADLLDDDSASTLSNGDRLPFFLLMDCLNGFFHDVYTQSLAESLLLAPKGGAVAVWASSGFTGAASQATMDQSLLRIISQNPATPLAEAIQNAKLGIVDPDVRRTWILFGDPGMQLQLPPRTNLPNASKPAPRGSIHRSIGRSNSEN
jgi:uncharacterized repeat protein (TIGR01451 family)